MAKHKVESTNEIEMTPLLLAPTAPVKQAEEIETIANFANGVEGGLIGNLFLKSFLDKLESFLAAHSYYFGLILFTKSVGFFGTLYVYIKNRRTNNNADHANLAYAALNFALISTAIAGAIFAAVTFVLITPILFVIALSLDTVRNFGLMCWNAFRSLKLSFDFRKSKVDLEAPENAYLKHRYLELKKDYRAGFEKHSIAFILSFLSTLAAAAIFLLPHVSIGAAAISGTVVAVSVIGVKSTIAGVLGAFAFAAPFVAFAPSIISGIGKGLYRLGSSIKSALFGPKKPEPEVVQEDKSEQAPLLPRSRSNSNENMERIAQERSEPIVWNTKFNHSGFFSERKHRTFFVVYAESEKQAVISLIAEIEAKGQVIATQIEKANESSWIESKLQNSARQQKLNALKLTHAFLTAKRDDGLNAFGEKHKGLDGTPMVTVTSLLNYIYAAWPKVDSSFWRNVSDTRDLLKAVKALDKYDSEQAQELRNSVSAKRAKAS